MANVSPNGDLDNDSFLLSLLQLRNNPDPDCELSPAEIVFGRPLRDVFSFVNRLAVFLLVLGAPLLPPDPIGLRRLGFYHKTSKL